MATIPFEFMCSKEDAFVMDPNHHSNVGYLLALDGFGLAAGGLRADLKVSIRTPGAAPAVPPATAPPTANVVGVLEKFSWNGGTGDPLNLDFWVSQETAIQIKALQQTPLRSSVVKAANFEVIGYDQEIKVWFTQLAMEQPLSGIIAGKENPQLTVDLTPVQVTAGVDVNVYKVTIAISPGANRAYNLQLASSSAKKVVKPWGLVVGSLSK